MPIKEYHPVNLPSRLHKTAKTLIRDRTKLDYEGITESVSKILGAPFPFIEVR